tara:strand:- start:821 stop:1072 length:252 start_codon:yes stop_codon:yes gene_type:complete
MNNSSQNNHNNTEIIIKQVFLTVDPGDFVRWDDLFSMIIMWVLIYYVVKIMFKTCKKDKTTILPAHAVIVGDDNGSARVVMAS